MTWKTDLSRDLNKSKSHLEESKELFEKCAAITKDGVILSDEFLQQQLDVIESMAHTLVAYRKMLRTRIALRKENTGGSVVKKA